MPELERAAGAGGAEAHLISEAKRLIDRIARAPRFAGSAGEAEARGLCAAELRGAGFQITEKELEFSEWPGRWGVPLISGWILLGIVTTTALSAKFGPDVGGFGWLLIVVSGNLVGGRWRRRATQTLPWLRSRATNLEATRGTPKVWLVAHLDSKSQTVPMLLRVTSHITLIATLCLAVFTVFLLQWTLIGSAPWMWIALAGCVAAAPSLFCFVGNESRGALDNATGVAAVVLAARILPKERSVGVLLTSGEELDLAGARAWSDGVSRGTIIVNCDTVDDSGRWRCMYQARPHAPVVAAQTVAGRLGIGLRVGKMIPGILTDSLAFEAAGLAAVTISRGTLRTLARLHTAGDTSERITGTGAATAARLLAAMIEELS